MKFKVTHFDSQRGNLLLHFDKPSVPFTLKVPIGPDNRYITGDELVKYIAERINADAFKRFVDVQNNVTNTDEMIALIGTEHEINDDDVYARAQPLFAIKEANVSRISNADLAYIKQLIDEAIAEKGGQ